MCAILFAAIHGCAAFRPRELTVAELAELADRELDEPMPLWPVKLEDGQVEAQAEARAAPASHVDDGGDTLLLNLGTEEPVRCRRLGPRQEAAGLMHARMQEARAKVQVRGFEVTAVEPAGGAVVLFAEATYLTKGGKAVGTLKLAVAPGERRAFFCEHDEVGYAKTFRRIVVQLVASARRSGEQPPDFWDALEVKLDGHLAGILTRLQRGASFTTVESSLLSQGDGRMKAVDAVRIETLDAEGALRAQRTSLVADGIAELELSLERKGDGYAADGLFAQKPFRADFKPAERLVTTPLLSQLLAAARAGNRETALNVQAWRASVNPSGATPLEYRVGADGRVEEVKLRELRKAALDASGLPIEWESGAGGAIATVRRISRHGVLRR